MNQYQQIYLNHKKLSPYYTFITLLNFDRFMTELFPKTIQINQDYLGSLNNSIDQYKYRFFYVGEETLHWLKDTENANDPKLSTSFTTRNIVNSIPYYDANNVLVPDMYLGMDKLLAFGAEIKRYERGRSESFRTNPKKALLEYLNNDIYSSMFTSSYYYSLKNYVNKIKQIEDNEINSNKSGILSNLPKIIEMIAWEIDKSFNPDYIVYGQNSAKFLNTSEYEKIKWKDKKFIF